MLIVKSMQSHLRLRGVPKLTHSSVYRISQKDQRFLRFIDLDAKYLSEIPLIFQPLKPVIYGIKDVILDVNSYLGLPWWVIIMAASLVSRIVIFPLIFVQMKKMSRIGAVWPVFTHIKEAWKHSNLSQIQKIKLSWSLYGKLAKQQNFRLRTVFVYNLAYYPILISMIYSLRSLLSTDIVGQSGFLYLSTLADIDPYYILPTLTVAAYYWNFQRFITPQNKHTLISKVRSVCQVFLIIWYPFLCCWPSGIVLYMFCNAMVSIAQSTLMKSMWFQLKLNPKIMHYNYMLSTVEYDKTTSDSIIEAIKTGQQSLKQKSIKEQLLVLQTEEMVANLNKQLLKDQQEQRELIKSKANQILLTDKNSTQNDKKILFKQSKQQGLLNSKEMRQQKSVKKQQQGIKQKINQQMKQQNLQQQQDKQQRPIGKGKNEFQIKRQEKLANKKKSQLPKNKRIK